MDENAFWVAIWRTAGATICGLAIIIAGCTYSNKQRITEMVEKGANPLQAACAIGDNMNACIAAGK